MRAGAGWSKNSRVSFIRKQRMRQELLKNFSVPNFSFKNRGNVHSKYRRLIFHENIHSNSLNDF